MVMRIFLAAVFASVLLSCGTDYKQKKDITAAPSFFVVRELIIKPQCISCHPAFESHKELMGLVQPGDAGASKLYNMISSDEMPPTGRKVAKQKKEYLKTWIDAGAPL